MGGRKVSRGVKKSHEKVGESQVEGTIQVPRNNIKARLQAYIKKTEVDERKVFVGGHEVRT